MYSLKTSILYDVADKKYLASTTNTSPTDKNTRSETVIEKVYQKTPKITRRVCIRTVNKQQKRKALTCGGNKTLSRPVTCKGALGKTLTALKLPATSTLPAAGSGKEGRGAFPSLV